MAALSEDLTVALATQFQRAAADPSRPQMVNANAGSGKTKVLVDRVSRILLQGTDPDKILCLTYTRAAASEMQERLFDKFSDWSILPDAALKEKLVELYGQPFAEIRPPLNLDRVRTLFARALETPEGLKVMTIHAFCEKIIARFPIEAGIMPGFEPLDEQASLDLLKAGYSRLLQQAQSDTDIAEALHLLTRIYADSTLEALLMAGAKDMELLNDWVAAGGVRPFRQATGLNPGETPETIAAEAWQATDQGRLRAFGHLCAGKGGYAEKFATAITQAFARSDPAEAFQIYANVVLKGDGQVTTQMPAKAVTQIDDFLTKDSPEAHRVAAEVARMKAVKIAQISEAYLTLATVLARDFQMAKHAARGLDFNDLILKVRDLLTRTDVSDWVAYKLDGGVEHVLLDEAQDTSPTQWQIIDALTQAFVQDSPDRDGPPRTFFAVGDPKQSIYRFQGAAPRLFMQSIRDRAIDGQGVSLRMSFRSSQHVLDVVDRLFIEERGLNAMFDPETVPEMSDIQRHVAHREDPGRVELWPLVPRSETVAEKEPWDTTPVDAVGEGDPKVRLAREIAHTIRHWIEQKDPVFDRDLGQHRPIHAGDVLILVQKRIGGLFDALIRELKRADLPVAGADRLVLQEATIIRDLLSMTRFVLLPSDELSLAEVLKSPLFGLDDHQLFALAVDREKQSLWQTVQERAPAVADALRQTLNDAHLPPYDFYARLLDRRQASGVTYREALFARLGLESREALNAFLATALEHQQRRAPSLQRFLQSFTAGDIEIKRDKDPAGREVRVMTVHGAKGLEAPIVFMPDTTRAPSERVSGVIRADKSWIIAPSKSESILRTDEYRAAQFAEEMREYMRLLYVAMTRAESRLILCGAWHGQSKTGYAEGSWYDWLQRTFQDLPAQPLETGFDTPDGGGLWYGGGLIGAKTGTPAPADAPADLPDWIEKNHPAEPMRKRTASPSALLAQMEPLERSPREDSVIRGVLIHRLLEVLPDHPADRRHAVAEQWFAGQPAIDEPMKQALMEEVFRVLDHPDFKHVFAEGSRAEVSLAGQVETIKGGTVFLSAQVDRLRVTDDVIFLVDYKSNRRPPARVDDVDLAYIAQMAAYRELARSIWKGRHVKCGLLWTHHPDLMWLPDGVMDAALTMINDRPTSEGDSAERLL
jgi:ATP-dependent helicase/nuclease subunit A